MQIKFDKFLSKFPGAKKMEGIKRVRDGSMGRNDKLGYDFLNIIACQNEGKNFEITPHSSDLLAMDLEENSLI